MDRPPSTPPPGRAARVGKDLPISARRAWDLVTDVRNHARWIPWTRIDAPNRLHVGDRFSGASGPRFLPGGGLVDRMQIERLDPPSPDGDGADGAAGVAVYRKLGPVLLGTAEVHVRPTGPTTCRVTWVERVHLRGLPPRVTAPVVRPALAGMSWLLLRKISAEVRSMRG